MASSFPPDIPELTLEERAAFEKWLLSRGATPDQVKEQLNNLSEGRRMTRSGYESVYGQEAFNPLAGGDPWQYANWLGYTTGRPIRRAISSLMETTPGVPSVQAATGIPGRGKPAPATSTPAAPAAPRSDLGTVTVQEERPPIPGRAWGGGGYTPTPGTRIGGGGTIPGAGFPSLTGRPVFAGNTPEIAERASLAAKAGKYALEQTPTGVQSKGAFSPGRLPETYLGKSFEEVSRTESPLIQQLWQENENQRLTNQMNQTTLKLEAAKARIATEQAEEAELPWEEQMRRYTDRQMALAQRILAQEMPLIEARVNRKVELTKMMFAREGKPFGPQEEEIMRETLLDQEKHQALSKWMTSITPATLGALFRSQGMLNPYMLGGLAGLTGGQAGGTGGGEPGI